MIPLCKVARCVATTCARGTGTHGEVLNLHTDPPPHTHTHTTTQHNTQHTPQHTTPHGDRETHRDRQRQTETEPLNFNVTPIEAC